MKETLVIMINTKTLRQFYRQERAKMEKNCLIGSWILGIIATVPAVIIVALVVRFSCLAIVALHNIIK
jgi:hypothetical protein